MTDFACFAVAAESAFDCPSGAFLTAYTTNRTSANELALEASPISLMVLSLVAEVGAWRGSAGELLEELNMRAGEYCQLERWLRTPRP